MPENQPKFFTLHLNQPCEIRWHTATKTIIVKTEDESIYIFDCEKKELIEQYYDSPKIWRFKDSGEGLKKKP